VKTCLLQQKLKLQAQETIEKSLVPRRYGRCSIFSSPIRTYSPTLKQRIWPADEYKTPAAWTRRLIQ